MAPTTFDTTPPSRGRRRPPRRNGSRERRPNLGPRDGGTYEEVAAWLRQNPDLGYEDVEELAGELLRAWAKRRGIRSD